MFNPRGRLKELITPPQLHTVRLIAVASNLENAQSLQSNELGKNTPKLFAFGIAPRGIIAIGLVPMGLIAIGGVSMGVVTISAVGMGLINVCLVGCGLIIYGVKTMGLF